jgi:hypothetical protein
MSQKNNSNYLAVLLFFLVSLCLGFLLDVFTTLIPSYVLSQYSQLLIPILSFLFIVFIVYIIFSEKFWHSLFFVILFVCSYLYMTFPTLTLFLLLLAAFGICALYSQYYLPSLQVSLFSLATILVLILSLIVGVIVIDETYGFASFDTYHDPRYPIVLSGNFSHCCDGSSREFYLVFEPVVASEGSISGATYRNATPLPDDFEQIQFVFNDNFRQAVPLENGTIVIPQYVESVAVLFLSSDYATRYSDYTGYFHSTKAVYTLSYKYAFFNEHERRYIAGDFIWYIFRFVAIIFIVIPIAAASFYIMSIHGLKSLLASLYLRKDDEVIGVNGEDGVTVVVKSKSHKVVKSKQQVKSQKAMRK